MDNEHRKCSVDSCERDAYFSKEWCYKHYRRWLKSGDPLVMQNYVGDPARAFQARTERRGDCLVWTGALCNDGYGRMKINRRMVRTHNFAWEQVNGPIPEGLILDHICWNRACAEVKHLRLATLSENQWNQSTARAASGYRNVYRTREGTYYVQIRHNYQKINFGTYATIEEAAQVAARERARLFGDFAGLG